MTAQLTHQGIQAGTTGRTASAERGLLRAACRRIHHAFQEMNYASRRTVELQAPWTVDKEWHRR
jgi:hypothetical protein